MNSTVNGSGSAHCSSPANPTAEKIGTTFAYCLILLFSLVGNSLICIIVYKTRTMRKPTNFFIVNMAMSDLLYPILLFPWALANLYVDSWLVSGALGQALCKLSWFLPNVSTVVSIQSLILISVDRFGAVVLPYRYPFMNTKQCTVFILITWIVAMAICSPYLVALNLVENAGKMACDRSKENWRDAFGKASSFADYLLSVYVVILYVPLALLIVLYSIILCTLKSRKIAGQRFVNAGNKREKMNRNVLKMAIAIVVGFVLCWTPISIVNLLKFFAWNEKYPCSTFLYMSRIIVSFMAQSNCAVNPWICLIYSGAYRQGLKKLFNIVNTKSRANQHLMDMFEEIEMSPNTVQN